MNTTEQQFLKELDDKLWKAADKLRSNLDAANYKHIMLGLKEIKKHDFVLTPGRYVGAPEQEGDGEPFAEKMARLTAQLKAQFEESDRLEAEIKCNLGGWGMSGAKEQVAEVQDFAHV
jgi:type I restriction-modification system DNA methylase subunit